MIKFTKICAAVAALALSPMAAQALTYGIDFDGTNIDISGTITTDGTLGTFLGSASFFGTVTALNLTVTAGTGSSAVTDIYDTVFIPRRGVGSSLGYTVSETTLSITGGSGSIGPTFVTGNFASSLTNSFVALETTTLRFVNNGTGAFSFTETGVSSLTFTAPPAAPIPLPAAAPLLGSVLAGMGVLGWRKRHGAAVGKGVTS